ncbi:MAG TPA: glycosyltransferase family 39 protein [Nitrospiraceae bacterium]|nr:glycosyltransferase family 39 protein [Nitrospiraceae bacterium]
MNDSLKVGPLLLVIGLASVLFLSGLGSVALTDRDEGRNAEAGREMLESGDWITPTFNYEPRFIKPALLYWLMSASYWAFDTNEFTARLPSALFGIGLVTLQYLFLARIRGTTVGTFGALILLLNIEVIILGRQALTDMVLMFFTTLSAYAFWLGFNGKAPRRHWLLLSYAAMACGTLDKGPPGFLVPLLGIIPYLTVTKQWQRYWREGFPLGGMATFLALALPYYAAMLWLHGATYSSQVQAHTVSRFFNPFYGWGGTIGFYVPVLLVGFFPWSPLLAAALYDTYKEWRHPHRRLAAGGAVLADQTAGREQDLELFAALWFVAVFIFFSLGATRLPHYIGPLYPAAATAVALYWARARHGVESRGFRPALMATVVLGSVLAFMCAALPSVFEAFAERAAKDFPYATQFHFGAGPYATAAILAIGMAGLAYVGFSQARRENVFWVAGTTVALVMLITWHFTLVQLSQYFLAPPQELASTAGPLLKPTDRLIVYGPNRPSTVFYAKRKIVVIRRNEEENIRSYVKEPGRTMIILPATLRDKLPEETAGFAVLQERFGWILIAG